MKKIITLLLLTSAMYSQTVNVQGCDLTYDARISTLTLTIPKDIMKVDVGTKKVAVVLYSSAKIVINGKTSNAWFIHEGLIVQPTALFTYTSDRSVDFKQNTQQYIYTFTQVPQGEYFVEVNYIENNKTLYSYLSTLTTK